MIIQINIFSCDICKKIIKQTLEETGSFSDPVVDDSELKFFTKYDKEGRKFYSGEACLECVSLFTLPNTEFEFYKIDNS